MTSQNFSAGDVLRRAFPGIPAPEAQEMVAIGEVQAQQSGVVLCAEGVIENSFYIILDGKVEVTKKLNTKETRLLKFLWPGDFFGEMGLIHNAPRAATVKTIEPTTVLCIHKTDFDQLLQRSASVSLAIIKEVSRRLRENDEMAIEDLRLKAGELAVAYQRLAQEDFARREFLTTIAHELRTPLTSASGFLDMALTGELDPNTLQIALDTIARNIQQIVSLVNDILFLQEVELVLPEMHLVDLRDVVQSALEQLQPRIASGVIQLTLDLPAELPKVHGHYKSLERAITMVLDNAFKFSPNGGEVRVSAQTDGDWVTIQICDHGVGIAPKDLPNIFDRFFHIDEMGDQLFGGLGLGLAITKQVIEQHQGQVIVESTEGEGSTFTLSIPVNEEFEEYGIDEADNR